MTRFDDNFDAGYLDTHDESADDRVGELFLTAQSERSDLSEDDDWVEAEPWEEADRWDEPLYEPPEEEYNEFDYSELGPEELELLRPDLFEEFDDSMPYNPHSDELDLLDSGLDVNGDPMPYEERAARQEEIYATPYDPYADELEMLDLGLDMNGEPLSPGARLMRQDQIRSEVANQALQQQFVQHVTESKDSFIDYFVGAIPDREIGEHLRGKLSRMDPVSVFHVVNDPEQMENALLIAEGLAARRARSLGDFARTGAPNGGDPRASGGRRSGRQSADEDFLTMIAQDTGLSEAEARRAARSKLG